MGRSITEGLYLSPLTRHGADERVREEDVKDLNDDAVLYSIRGEAPEGWYNAGTREHASKGSGYQDHQIFKKLPTNAPTNTDEPVEEKKTNTDKIKDIPKTQASVPPSQEVTDAKKRVAAYDPSNFGVYGAKKSPFAERSSEIYNPNQGFQSSVSSEGNQQALSFMQDKLNKTKDQFNFKPTLS